MTILAPAPRRVKFEALVEQDGSILINGTTYTIEAIPAGEFGTVAFRLSKLAGDGAVYDVVRTHQGVVECDCPDYEARHRGNGFGCCKHGRALVELGMIPTAGPDESHLAELEPSWSILPRVDGGGLSPEEWARLTRQRDKVKAAFLADQPDANAVEVRRVVSAAAHDALRQILKGRAVATVATATTLDADHPVDANEMVTTPQPSGVAVRQTPDADHFTDASKMVTTPLPAGADPSMSPEELADLEELNRLNPAGAVEANLDEFPAFDRWPASTSDWYWAADDIDSIEPAEPEARLTLAELVELQARRWRSIDSGAGDLIGSRLEQLAREIRATSAHHPGLVDDRLAILERDYSEPLELAHA